MDFGNCNVKFCFDNDCFIYGGINNSLFDRDVLFDTMAISCVHNLENLNR